MKTPINHNNNKHNFLINKVLIIKLLKFISKYFIKLKDSDHMIDYWCNKIDTMISNHGVNYTITRIKNIRLITTRFLCGDPMLSNSFNIAVNSIGLPRQLGPLQDLADPHNHAKVRLLMTLLILSRVIKGGYKKPDLSSIENRSSFVMNSDLKDDIRIAINSLGLLPKHRLIDETIDPPKYEDFHPTTKSGPNGQALLTSINDAHGMYQQKDLRTSLDIVSGSPLLWYWLEGIATSIKLKDWSKEFGTSVSTKLRKISYVYDPEAKIRPIAIFDYWSQSALKPLHDKIMKILRSIPSDRTFNHTEGIPEKSEHDHYWSLDLSNATDRFPVGFQTEVLSVIFGEQYSQAWKEIMISLPFETPCGRSVYYNAGQPMGAFSSWAVFALSHHVVIHICANRCGIPAKGNYILLGDDIVICNDKIAHEYLSLMKDLGVDISQNKSHKSRNMYEFAKRWYINNTEVSGIPVRGYLEVGQFWYRVIPELWDAQNRSGLQDIILGIGAFKEILRILNLPPRFSKRAYTTIIWLSYLHTKDQCYLNIFLSKLDIKHNCHMPIGDQKDQLETILTDLLARNLERGFWNLRNEVKNFIRYTDGLIHRAMENPRNAAGLNNQARSIPPIRVGLNLLQDARNNLQRLIDRDLTTNEVRELSNRGVPTSPFDYFHSRKKNMIIKSQTDLISEISQYCKVLKDLNTRAVNPNGPDEHQLFQEQYRFLPSYSRRKVSIGYPLTGGHKNM